eukprot:Awhi_evm1s9585
MASSSFRRESFDQEDLETPSSSTNLLEREMEKANNSSVNGLCPFVFFSVLASVVAGSFQYGWAVGFVNNTKINIIADFSDGFSDSHWNFF